MRAKHGARERFKHVLALPALHQRVWAAQSWSFFQQVGKQPCYLAQPGLTERNKRASQCLTSKPCRYRREGQSSLGGITTGGSRSDAVPFHPVEPRRA